MYTTTTTHSFEMLKKGRKKVYLTFMIYDEIQTPKNNTRCGFKSFQSNCITMKDPVLFPKKAEDLPNSESSSTRRWPRNTN